MFKKLALLLIGLAAATAAALFLVIFPPIKATHPAIAGGTMPKLVPLRDFYADPNARWRFRLSPDGARIAWLEAKRLKPALWVRALDGEDVEIYHTPDTVRWFTWSSDGRYLLYQADRDGWENDQIVSVDVTRPGSAPRTYDFGKDVRSWIEFVPRDSGSDILVSHNGRDRSKFDLYRLNLDTGETSALDLISERSVNWSFDRDGTLFARLISGQQSQWRYEALMTDGTWRELARGGMEDEFWLLSRPDETGQAIALSNLNRDNRVLMRLNVLTGEEKVMHAPDAVDAGWIITHPVTRKPLMALDYPGEQTRSFFDDSARDMVDLLGDTDDKALHLVSSTDDFTKAIWETEDSREGWRTYLVDRTAGTADLLQTPGIAKEADNLSDLEPVFIPAQDGLTIPAYLTRPKGTVGPAPLVILIHGGPVARSYWGYKDLHLWLANRGYAVLNVNYRGGSGYGRAFKEAAIGEVSRKMHTDIVDARAWAVEEGIADPAKVAALGGSFGGLKTLTALTQSPGLFAAGVSINGVSDISTMIGEVPVYWTGWPDWVRKYLGDPDNEDDLQMMRDRSPLYHADNVQSPVMIIQGSNDVRVVQSQSDRMVEALKAAGKDVSYELIDGAGHTFSNMSWQQKMIMHRKIERFLATHLGGRADGFDYGVLGAYIIP
ncbi:MAG: S9 family peptidase [Pseudomonadota bacterium]